MRAEGYSFCIIAGGRRPVKLARLIASIHSQAIPAYEIIVAGAATAPGVTYLPMAEAAAQGKTCHLRNAAARQSRFKWIVFADDDIILTPKWYLSLRRHQSPADMISTRLLNLDGTRHWDWATTGGPRGQVLLDYEECDPFLYLTGGLLIVRAALWEAVPWNEKLRYRQAEDVVFSRDAFRRGFRNSFCKGCISIHNDETCTQIGRRVVRRTSEGAMLWMTNNLASFGPEELIARSVRELEARHIAEAGDCLRYALYKTPDSSDGKRRLRAIEMACGGSIDSGRWQPHPII